MITLAPLAECGLARHAFFTRRGGVSQGLFASLNCGFGSGDTAERVAENRALAVRRLDLPADRLVTCHQCHGVEVVAVERAWRREEAPRADALVTAQPGLALGILTADCAPVLFLDPVAQVVGAAHAGWRGALAGVLEATVAGMERLGAQRRRLYAGIGPCIGRASYEVGPEFEREFLAGDPGNRDFFAPAVRSGHFLFDLAGYVARRLACLGLAAVAATGDDTVTDPARFFSYRRARLAGETNYGRLLSAIALAP
jgi:polyphenol oxidase